MEAQRTGASKKQETATIVLAHMETFGSYR